MSAGCVYGTRRRLLYSYKDALHGALRGIKEPETNPGNLLGQLGTDGNGFAAAFKGLFSPTGCLAQIANLLGEGPAQINSEPSRISLSLDSVFSLCNYKSLSADAVPKCSGCIS